MKAVAMVMVGCLACTWHSEITLRNVDAPDCAARRHVMELHAATIADAQERGQYLVALPECSTREWHDERSGRCSEQAPARPGVVLVSCHERQETHGVAIALLGFVAAAATFVIIWSWNFQPMI